MSATSRLTQKDSLAPSSLLFVHLLAGPLKEGRVTRWKEPGPLLTTWKDACQSGSLNWTLLNWRKRFLLFEATKTWEFICYTCKDYLTNLGHRYSMSVKSHSSLFIWALNPLWLPYSCGLGTGVSISQGHLLEKTKYS